MIKSTMKATIKIQKSQQNKMHKRVGALFALFSLATVMTQCGVISSENVCIVGCSSVIYDGNGSDGGTVPVDSAEYADGDTVTVLSGDGLTKTDNFFNGWNTVADGTGASYFPSETMIIADSDVTLYAQWSVDSVYTITFDANGGTGTMSTQSIAENTTTELIDNLFTRDGYLFAGWAVSADGPVFYNNMQSITMGGSDFTLYAKWAQSDTLKLYYHFNNQDVTDSSGNGADGTAHDVTYVSDGKGGYAVQMNGTNSFIEFPNDYLKGNSEFTMMIRFKAEEGQGGLLFGYQNAAVGEVVTQYVPVLGVRSDGKLRAELWIGGQLEILSDTRVDDGQWHIAYFSVTPGSIQLFLDGVEIGSNAGTINHLNMSFNQIGTGNAAGRTLMPDVTGGLNGWYYFEGLVDDFYFYNTAL